MATERVPGDAADDSPPIPEVLVVDDDKDLADTCEYWLQQEGYTVRTAYGGEDALSEIDEHVDVVLLDRRMPTLSGDEVLEQIRDRGFDCRIAMMTAVEPDTDIVDMPFDEYIVKPVSKSEVQEVVDELLARARFEEDVQEYFALNSTEQALESQDLEDLRDPQVLDELHTEIQQTRAGREAELEQHQRQLDRLTRINSLIREVDQALVDASTREDIERAVCDTVISTAPYRGAWIAEYVDAIDALSPRASSGLDNAISDQAVDDLTADVTEAISSGKVNVVEDVPETHYDELFGDDPDAPVRENTAVAIVPLMYQGTAYGALLLYADDPTAFAEEELEVFHELGASIGNGINSVESKKLLLADTIVELEFEHADDTDPFISLAQETGGSLTLKGFAPTNEGGLTCYIEAADIDGDAILDHAAERTAVDHVRVVADRGDTTLFEWAVVDSSILVTLSEFGANVTTLEVEDGRGRVIAEVAPEADLPTIVDAVESSFPQIDVVAKRQVERSVQSTESFHQDLDERLTDRQRAVLEATYSGGYFTWPRESTAEDVAESMGISAPTLHEHLRAAQRKLLEAFFDETE